MKKIILLILFCSLFIKSFGQDNPYEVFGYKPKAIFKDSKDDVFRIKNIDTGSVVKYLEIDARKHFVSLFNGKDSIIQRIAISDDNLFRFISVDPITKKYPELTPYQFASNSPISGIDRDGLEYYYIGDGTLIGRVGTDTRVMLISKDVPIAKAREMVASAHGGQSNIEQLNASSKFVGMTNNELNTRAFMSTLKQTENHAEGPLPYNAWNGFKHGKLITFTDNSYSDAPEDYAHHPGANPDHHNGSAAGAYQIMKMSWGKTSKPFSPVNQDKWVLDRITNERHALPQVMAGDITGAIAKLRSEWRSLPGPDLQDQSITMDKVKTLFKGNVANELNGNTNIAIPVGTTLNGFVKSQ